MSTPDSLKAQWQANRRLRIAVGLAALFGLLHLAFALSDARSARIEAYLTDRALLERLEGAAADAEWVGRATEAREALDAMEATMAAAVGAGEAQAELQALLDGLATGAGIAGSRVRSEAAVPIEGLPGVWQVVARLDASASPTAIEALLHELAGRPWLRVERIEIRDGNPGPIQLVVRAYLRQQEGAP
ncbi:MAG TPA: hypothetical protein DCM32_01595 [Xanthomonadaceae bacterium]|jgi:hypothetical protein|nr:hypothetical protein [Xanthomonadaceae bacterium]